VSAQDGAEKAQLEMKLSGYLRWFKGCRLVVEPGCGRGEFLALLKGQGIQGLGLELSPANVRACQERGAQALQGDAIRLLARQKPASFDGFFCSNLVEHLAPRDFERFLDLACGRLAKGGTLVLVTANPRCLGIHADSFWHDITHQRFYPLPLLRRLLEERGLKVVEAKADERLRPQSPHRRLVRALRTALVGDYFGPPEIYIAAIKPGR
jgi:O-antigen chain-terminating methyltransferase